MGGKKNKFFHVFICYLRKDHQNSSENILWNFNVKWIFFLWFQTGKVLSPLILESQQRTTANGIKERKKGRKHCRDLQISCQHQDSERMVSPGKLASCLSAYYVAMNDPWKGRLVPACTPNYLGPNHLPVPRVGLGSQGRKSSSDFPGIDRNCCPHSSLPGPHLPLLSTP